MGQVTVGAVGGHGTVGATGAVEDQGPVVAVDDRGPTGAVGGRGLTVDREGPSKVRDGGDDPSLEPSAAYGPTVPSVPYGSHGTDGGAVMVLVGRLAPWVLDRGRYTGIPARSAERMSAAFFCRLGGRSHANTGHGSRPLPETLS